MPVLTNRQIAGYVTLALDLDHIRQFSDRLMPTEERYTPIADAIKGNYAFIWDYKSRSISHPRDYFIVGYDPQTGLPATPWMDEDLYNEWQASGKPSHEFLAETPAFRDQNLKRKPAKATGPSKLFVLDTNVLMHDPMCLFRFEEHDIYLPMIVLEELDGHKKGMSEVARNARQTSRTLDALAGVPNAGLMELKS